MKDPASAFPKSDKVEAEQWVAEGSTLSVTHMPSRNEMQVVFIVPTLNEEEGIGVVLSGIGKVMQGNHTILVVDGHSEDRTTQIARNKGATVVSQRGRGYGDAYRTGFDYASKELGAHIAVMIDGDGSYDPEDIPRLLNPILEDRADLVIGNRLVNLKEGSMYFINKVGNIILSWIARRTLGLKVGDTQCGLRALRTDLIRGLVLKEDGMPFAIEMLNEARRSKARIVDVPIAYHRRMGYSKLSPIRDGVRILRAILRLATANIRSRRGRIK